MPRNLGRTSYYCDCELVLEEPIRRITKKDAGDDYYPAYKDMLVANAHCPDCWATYLAWMGHVPYLGTGLPPDPNGILDLSFRSSFSADPGDEDLPQFHIVHHLELSRVPYSGRTAKPPPNTLTRTWRTGGT